MYIGVSLQMWLLQEGHINEIFIALLLITKEEFPSFYSTKHGHVSSKLVISLKVSSKSKVGR